MNENLYHKQEVSPFVLHFIYLGYFYATFIYFTLDYTFIYYIFLVKHLESTIFSLKLLEGIL